MTFQSSSDDNSLLDSNITSQVPKSATSITGVQNSQNSGNTTISNIINIALIVIGVLLVFFAIAILIRLGNHNS